MVITVPLKLEKEKVRDLLIGIPRVVYRYRFVGERLSILGQNLRASRFEVHEGRISVGAVRPNLPSLKSVMLNVINHLEHRERSYALADEHGKRETAQKRVVRPRE